MKIIIGLILGLVVTTIPSIFGDPIPMASFINTEYENNDWLIIKLIVDEKNERIYASARLNEPTSSNVYQYGLLVIDTKNTHYQITNRLIYQNPILFTYAESNDMIYLLEWNTNYVSVMDAKSMNELSRIELEGMSNDAIHDPDNKLRPEEMFTNDLNGTILISLENATSSITVHSNKILVVDTDKNTTVEEFVIDGFARQLQLDKRNDLVYFLDFYNKKYYILDNKQNLTTKNLNDERFVYNFVANSEMNNAIVFLGDQYAHIDAIKIINFSDDSFTYLDNPSLYSISQPIISEKHNTVFFTSSTKDNEINIVKYDESGYAYEKSFELSGHPQQGELLFGIDETNDKIFVNTQHGIAVYDIEKVINAPICGVGTILINYVCVVDEEFVKQSHEMKFNEILQNFHNSATVDTAPFFEKISKLTSDPTTASESIIQIYKEIAAKQIAQIDYAKKLAENEIDNSNFSDEEKSEYKTKLADEAKRIKDHILEAVSSQIPILEEAIKKEREKQSLKKEIQSEAAKIPTESLKPKCGSGTIEKNGICVPIEQEQSDVKSTGCLIATATYGTELAPQVQLLREIRDHTLLQTNSGSSFMSGFNVIYYSFSPTVADLERQSPVFKEIVKVTITPMLSTLSILNYVDVDSEQEMFSYGVGIILLNLVMYFVVPAIVILNMRKRLGVRR